MANMKNAARSMAADRLTSALGAGADFAGSAEEETGGLPAPGGGEDIESGLAIIETAIAGLPEDKAAEARMHIEAIRGLFEGGAVPAPEGAAEPPVPEAPAGGGV